MPYSEIRITLNETTNLTTVYIVSSFAVRTYVLWLLSLVPALLLYSSIFAGFPASDEVTSRTPTGGCRNADLPAGRQRGSTSRIEGSARAERGRDAPGRAMPRPRAAVGEARATFSAYADKKEISATPHQHRRRRRDDLRSEPP